jgi:hypothetical protein
MTAVVGARSLFKFDAGVVHALMQPRYQNSSRGQFISEDPVFLGDPRQQVLTDPQSLNSYSCANDNTTTKSDPLGLATYVYANGGGMTGVDTWNKGTYYQSGDAALLNMNAAYAQNNALGSSPADWLQFKNLVQKGGAWDYLSQANPSAGGRGFFFVGNSISSPGDHGVSVLGQKQK